MLKKLVGQIYKYTDDFKLYIVEDGQKRRTINWLFKKFNEEDKNFNVIQHGENKGVAKSWNDGLVEAYNDGCTHFAVINDDVELCENWAKEIKDKLKDTNLVFLNQPSPIDFTGWFFSFDRKTLETVGYFDEQFEKFTSEDYDWWIRFLNSGLKYSKINLPIIHHGSTTLNKLDTDLFREVWNENWLKLRKKYPHRRFHEQLI